MRDLKMFVIKSITILMMILISTGMTLLMYKSVAKEIRAEETGERMIEYDYYNGDAADNDGEYDNGDFSHSRFLTNI